MPCPMFLAVESGRARAQRHFLAGNDALPDMRLASDQMCGNSRSTSERLFKHTLNPSMVVTFQSGQD